MVLDILAAQYLYGPNLTFHAGNDVYLFSSDKDYHETIWDAGGVDTISTQGVADLVVIDLRPGSYSDVGTEVRVFTPAGELAPITSTVGIAVGVIIENAIGGAGNDKIIGNNAANQLDGGGGDDVVTGLGGNDTLNGGLGLDTCDPLWFNR